MSDHFPRWLRHPVREGNDWMARSRDLVTRSTAIEAVAPDPALFGCTFELCTVFDLADRMPYPHLLAALPPLEAIWTARHAGFRPPEAEPAAGLRCWYRNQTVSPAWLHAAGSNLAQLLHLLWRLGDTAEANQALLTRWDFFELFNGRRRVAATEAATFRTFWQKHCAEPQEILRRLGPVRAADVPFRDGHWMGDLIAGTSMVEIKTGVMTDEHLADAVLQTVRYALLAQDTGYDVTDVVIYLARYGLVIQTPLQQLADDLAGAAIDLDEGRSALASGHPPWRPNYRAAHHQGPMCGPDAS
jgi:hypothetical protein